MRHERIVAKAIYRFEAKLDSPLSLGGSSSYYTDHDIIRRGQDNAPFLPGSSLAGPIRSFAIARFGKEASFFEAKGDKASPFLVSDGEFLSETHLSSRDGIAIKGYDNEKGVFEKTPKDTAKYDYEILDRGSAFVFYLEVTLREHYQEDFALSGSSLENDLKTVEEQVKTIASGFSSHAIRLGFKKNRGLGCIQVTSLKGRSFYGDSLKDYLTYEENSLAEIPFEKEDGSPLIHISCPSSLLGAISIKNYSADPSLSYDFTQIMTHDKKGAVLPGSSLCGALRHQMDRIQKELGTHLDLSELFGNMNGKAGAFASKVNVEEAVFEGGHTFESTRTALDRISGSALNRALFTQNVYVKGKSTLTLSVRKEEKLNPHVGLLLLALLDLSKGYLALGGSTSIGYGTLEGEIYVDGEKLNPETDPYISALAQLGGE